jgi:hypothetical protein
MVTDRQRPTHEQVSVEPSVLRCAGTTMRRLADGRAYEKVILAG